MVRKIKHTQKKKTGTAVAAAAALAVKNINCSILTMAAKAALKCNTKKNQHQKKLWNYFLLFAINKH